MKYNILPLRDIIVYPGTVMPLFVGRDQSIELIEESTNNGVQIVLLTQKDAKVEKPSVNDVHNIGVLANIVQMIKLPDASIKLLVEGVSRVEVTTFYGDNLTQCEVKNLPISNFKTIEEVESSKKLLLKSFAKYLESQKKHPQEIVGSLEKTESISDLIDEISAHLQVPMEDKVKLLTTIKTSERFEVLFSLLENEVGSLGIQKKIQKRVKKQMDKNQREYYLNEQAKAIQKELEELDENKSDFGIIEKQVKKAKMPKKIKKKCLLEVEKLRKMPSMSSEATVLRNYLDNMIAYPWAKSSKVNLELANAKDILEDSHYGLEDVKKRIIEYIAVQQRTDKPGASILCLVGPPGVGKTSIAKSIAKAINREYIRMSLGGVSDESEIRGHRRTYIGAMPGRIIQNITKSKVNNPLFLLDEIDKMGKDHRGDPSAAMLEVLDPEQNNAFNDNYMEVDIDLSKVMFVATANSLDISGPLLDRMEVIQISGYTEKEKLKIGKKYLINKNIEKVGLKDSEINFTDKAIENIIENYTREAGVRQLDREIAKICRKVVTRISLLEIEKESVSKNNVAEYLGVPKYHHSKAVQITRSGQVNGLAWTSVGGELLTIEVVVLPGKGKVITTGKLGDVMKESIEAAMTVAKRYTYKTGISSKFFAEHDFHIHLPEAATPKDGPSAGGALSTALISAIMDEPVNNKIAMTGEVNLQGEVLAIGGLKEKLFAAAREKIEIAFIPKDNEKDLEEITDEIKNKIKIIPVNQVDEIFEIVFSKSFNASIKVDNTPPFVDRYLVSKSKCN